MKTKLHLLFILCAPLFFMACNNDNVETFDELWRVENEAQFARVTMNTEEFTRIESLTGNGHIMYRVLQEGSGERSPFSTERVGIRYVGWFKNNWSMPATFLNDRGRLITNKIIFDSTNNRGAGNHITQFHDVNIFIPGFADAIQHMRVGDKWEVWIPWTLGYGRQGVPNGRIRGYSTLVFEIELMEIR